MRIVKLWQVRMFRVCETLHRYRKRRPTHMAKSLNRSTPPPETCRRTVWLGTFIVAGLLASRGAANDGIPHLIDAPWRQTIGVGQPTRLPPVGSFSYDAAKTEELASSNEKNEQPTNSGDVDDQSISDELAWICKVKVGYDEAFVIASKEQLDLASADYPFQMKLNGWGQYRPWQS